MSSRFIFPGNNAVRPRDKGSLLAYFNFIDTETGLEYRDFRLLSGANGIFAAGPFRTYDVEGEDKPRYSDYVRAAYDEDTSKRDEIGVAFFAELAEAAHIEYERASKGGRAPAKKAPVKGASAKRAPAKTAGKPAARSGRGPVRTFDDDDDALPF